jgi:hypothetical protein
MNSNNLKVKNAFASFASHEDYCEILAGYKEDDSLKRLFQNNPYITIHMSARDRAEYKTFMDEKFDKQESAVSEPMNVQETMLGQYSGPKMGYPPFFNQPPLRIVHFDS